MGQSSSTKPNNPNSTETDNQPVGNMTGIKHFPSSSIRGQPASGGQIPLALYEPADSISDQPEWNDCDVPVWERHSDTTLPRNPFIHGGAIPADIKPKTVVLFGEAGVGKSSTINLMAGTEVTEVSSSLEPCTMEAKDYFFTLGGEIPFRIYDTVGLNEPEISVNTFFGAVEKAYELIRSLHDAGGIDLLLFCIRGNRITKTVQQNYSLFFEFLGEKKIPLAFVVTNLDHVDAMEDWWKENEQTFQKYGICSVAHACITAAPARVAALATKRQESRYALERMLQAAFNSPTPSYVRERSSWLANVMVFFWSILMKNKWFKKKELLKRLEKQCGFPREAAQKLADMLARGR